MLQEFVIRVNNGFISKPDGPKHRLLTFSIRNARRCSRTEAMDLACYACSAFPKAKVFIAHESRPDAEFDFKNPPEFIVAVGRKYLKTIKDGSVQLSYSLDDAYRHSKSDAFDVVMMLHLTWPDRVVYTAHMTTPFLAVLLHNSAPSQKEESDEGNGTSEFPSTENDEE